MVEVGAFVVGVVEEMEEEVVVVLVVKMEVEKVEHGWSKEEGGSSPLALCWLQNEKEEENERVREREVYI